MRLDLTTLPSARYGALIDALVKIHVLGTSQGRADVLDRVPAGWVGSIERRDATRADVMNIWDKACEHEGLPDLLAAIRFIDNGSVALTTLDRLLEELTAFVAANVRLYPSLATLTSAIRGTPRECALRWLGHLRSQIGDHDLGPDLSNRDLLLCLGEFQPSPCGDSFPLFVYVEGVAGDTLKGGELAAVHKTLETVASASGVTPSGIARLRGEVATARARFADAPEAGITLRSPPSVLVVIEPDLEQGGHYWTRFYDWQPWEFAADEQRFGSPGRVTNPSERWPSQTLDDLLSESGVAKIGKEVGQRLLKLPTAERLVEFLVPGSLICADFYGIKVRVDLGDEAPAVDVQLGNWARVVVRSWHRWQPRYQQMVGLVKEWRQRWEGFTGRSGNGPRVYWWKDVTEDPLGFLARVEYRSVGCLGLGFAARDHAKQVHSIILTAGAPVAVWVRTPIQGDLERLLTDLIDAATPGDLRDRVQGERANSTAVGKALTLFWDDPGRSPHPIDTD
jgi:vWA-MoxR associated protein C-terminal domain/Effector-associated domain 2